MKGDDIEFSTGVNRFNTLTEVLGYEKQHAEFKSMASLQPVGNCL